MEKDPFLNPNKNGQSGAKTMKTIYLTVDTECHNYEKVNQYIFGKTKRGTSSARSWKYRSMYSWIFRNAMPTETSTSVR